MRSIRRGAEGETEAWSTLLLRPLPRAADSQPGCRVAWWSPNPAGLVNRDVACPLLSLPLPLRTSPTTGEEVGEKKTRG